LFSLNKQLVQYCFVQLQYRVVAVTSTLKPAVLTKMQLGQ